MGCLVAMGHTHVARAGDEVEQLLVCGNFHTDEGCLKKSTITPLYIDRSALTTTLTSKNRHMAGFITC
jgi:hypothetical protein